MPDEYLWDRTGEPDPEIERLETLLKPYRCPPPKPARRSMLPWIALAASVAVFAILARNSTRPVVTEWMLDAGRQLTVGETVQTEAQGAQLSAPLVGQIELEPHSRLRVLAGKDDQRRLALDRGMLHATIWAPPTRFVVDTPSAKTIDLGCRYTLSVNPDGSGLVSVEHGWVAFHAGLRESFVPAGAACRTQRKTGPGLPYFEDSTPVFQQAVLTYEQSGTNLDKLLISARREDALTLWHLLSRTQGNEREQVIGFFTKLVPDADAAGLRAGAPTALDQSWNALGFGDTSWWRTWKQNW